MCEIVVLVEAEQNSDKSLDAQRFHVGDVIGVEEDGFEFGPAQRNNASIRIIKLPGVSIKDVEAFLTPELGDSKKQTLRRRGFKFDYKKFSEYKNDRVDPMGRKIFAPDDVLRFKVLKKDRIKPIDVIGKDAVDVLPEELIQEL